MTITGKPRGNYAKTAGRRREILEAGIEVFSAGGFRSGSIREIAERVGMSQAGLLHHFANKNELLAAVLELRDDLSREYTTGEEEDGLETIRGLIKLVEYNSSVPGLVELHTTLSAEATAPDHPAHEYFVRRYVWVSSFITAAFERMKAKGQLVPGVDPEAAARGMIAIMDGAQVQWLLDKESLDMAEETRMFVRLLITVDL
ncbi:AcrR family transcriptional regulator [Okibacterium sp. HSC-33S16]|uniref:TetR/AcrR family transcriptional regulator n=1 Tax=Okibacterium sp. HSC-33S16 TaxID=2910965 RepID=UPI0020A0CF19|nr:TetR/AcrR family transcriptional regulator [Okibacterium sp. HSC-33S16]MCP2031167.1 AcrR family transcriptional regulator [Okibacterium sp. HSC-33S16]